MSSISPPTDVDRQQRLLSHYIQRLLRVYGGEISLLQATEQAGENLPINSETAADQIEQGTTAGIYTTQIDEEKKIVGVNPLGTEPREVRELFDEGKTDIEDFHSVNRELASALHSAGYTSAADLSSADPHSLQSAVNESLSDDTTPVKEGIPEGFATPSELQSLADAGFATLQDVAHADVAALADAATTITETKAAQLQQHAKDEALVDRERIDRILEEAELHHPTAPRLLGEALDRYATRTEDGRGAARVTDIETGNKKVGDPLAADRDDIDPETLKQAPSKVSSAVQYVSDTGANADTPVDTGFTVLEDVGYEKVPRPDTHPQAGDDALPTDDNGDVIAPAIPVEPNRQLPIDELVAKKFRRGIVPVCLVGPPGSGKNYLFKYLAWATNRGYRSLDADESTMPEDLFGPLTPDENGLITPRSGPVKEGLLRGDIIVINEFPVMNASAATSLHRLLNEGTLLVKSHGELIEPHPAARIAITMNPPTRENRATEPMSRPTRGRFRRFRFPYPQRVDDEVEAISKQVNSPYTTVREQTLRKIVEFAHRTRKDEHSNWPTLSTRNLVILCEDIEDGVEPKAAVRGALDAVAEPHQHPEDAEEAINTVL